MKRLLFWESEHNRPSVAQQARRVGATSLVALALVGGAGGAVGSALTAAALSPQAAQASVTSAQTIAQTTTTTNVAGTVLDAVGPSVVEITTSVQRGFRNAAATGIGSGFVIDTSGLIATNDHVVDGASSITVTFSNGQKRTATVVGTDSAHDLAIIRVADMPSGIPAVTLGDSDQVAVGETAVAIGSPFGLEQTVTEGIISAVNRTWSTGGSTYTGLLQTDTAINPGNSGGPLLNAAGQVIGINTMIESPVEGNVGVGFAVPINTLKQLTVTYERNGQQQQATVTLQAASAS